MQAIMQAQIDQFENICLQRMDADNLILPEVYTVTKAQWIKSFKRKNKSI